MVTLWRHLANRYFGSTCQLNAIYLSHLKAGRRLPDVSQLWQWRKLLISRWRNMRVMLQVCMYVYQNTDFWCCVEQGSEQHVNGATQTAAADSSAGRAAYSQPLEFMQIACLFVVWLENHNRPLEYHCVHQCLDVPAHTVHTAQCTAGRILSNISTLFITYVHTSI